MKLKLLLLFLVVVGFCALTNAQTKRPYTNLVITEAQMHASEMNYFEITNMGTEDVNLKDFEFSHLGAWDSRVAELWPQLFAAPGFPKFMRLSKTDKILAPGKSFVIAAASDFNPKFWKKDPANYRERVTRKEFYSVDPTTKKVSSIADMLLHIPEYTVQPWKADSVSTNWQAIEGWGGRETYFLRHHYLNPITGAKDSAVIDQVGGVFTESDLTNTGGAADVAGFVNATDQAVLIRKNSVKTGNLDFFTGRGVDFADSEWIPVAAPGNWDFWGTAPWRAVFWTVGNQVNATFNANTLVSKTGKTIVDIVNNTITVPWGVRKADSLMFQFKKVPGLAWEYAYSPNSEDSLYLSARTDDTLKVYACGDIVTIKKFAIKVLPPTADDNIVIPKCPLNFTTGHPSSHPGAFGNMRVTNGVSPIDSITNLAFAIRVDTLYKYLEKAPKASWQIIYADGVVKPDLKRGDKLRVTSESGKTKDYYLKLEKYVPGSNALLSSITWPDIPAYFKGDIAALLGWKSDTIPAFLPSNKTYVVQVPLEYNGIPALVYTKQTLNSKVVVDRAKNLAGSVEDRTVTFTVTAENDTVISRYTVRFDKEKDYSNVQPFIAEPFISQFVWRVDWTSSAIEIANPGTQILDLSNYMFAAAWATEPNAFGWNNQTTEWANRYFKYIPGKKWQDEANWGVQPRIVIPDPAVNSIVYPQDVFVMGDVRNGFTTADKVPFMKEVDINFATVPTSVPGWEKLSNPWNEDINGRNIPSIWCNNVIVMYKILNDSVKSGLKPATDRNDFEVIDIFGGLNGNNWNPGGIDAGTQQVGWTRKPSVYKGNPVPNASFGTNPTDSEWTRQRPADFNNQNLGWPWTDFAVATGIGAVTLDEITIYRSTVASKVYKVSPGYSDKETIKGLTTGTTVTDFYGKIIKANPLQTLKVKTAAGDELADAASISNGDILEVLSADSVNTSKYILDVTVNGLSANATLTSTKYTVTVTGSTGTVGGFKQGTLLKTVFAGVVVPAGASINIIDANDAYMSLTKLNYDTAYVSVIATDKVFFEVIAENGTTKIVYQLTPISSPSDAYVTSDVYSIDQFASLIQFVPAGTSVYYLLANVTPAPGASVAIYDKAGFQRTEGTIYKDDKLIVTSADGKVTKAYYFSMLNYNVNKYLAYVISGDDAYTVNQLSMTITGPVTLSASEFFNKLYPSFGANLSVLDKDNKPNTTGTFKKGDKLLVTAADGMTTATYNISMITKAVDVTAETIKMYPNPTDGRVIVQGLEKGNRVRVINAAGVTLRDVIVNNSTEYVSLAAQPAGIYVFVVSNGDKFINIQKIVKK